MPIKGLTGNREVSGLPRLGTLRKGSPKTATGIGNDLDYFRLELEKEDPTVRSLFVAAHGEQPRTIRIFFPYATIEENWSAWNEEYTAGGFVRRCDGEKQVQWRDTNGKVSFVPRECVAAIKACKCARVGRLSVFVPAMRQPAYVSVETHSIHDIVTIDARLAHYARMFGQLSGVPFDLRRVPVEISTPGKDGKRARRVKHLIEIEVDAIYFEKWLGQQTESVRMILGTKPAPALPMPAIRDLGEDAYDPDLEVEEEPEVAPPQQHPAITPDGEIVDPEPTPKPVSAPAPKPVDLGWDDAWSDADKGAKLREIAALRRDWIGWKGVISTPSTAKELASLIDKAAAWLQVPVMPTKTETLGACVAALEKTVTAGDTPAGK